MNIRVILALMACIACLAGNAQQIKVMTFNIRFGELADMQQIAEAINREKPDLVALQEVDINAHRTPAVKAGSTNYIAQLSGYTNMHAIFGRTIFFTGGEYGVAILSKYSFEQTENQQYQTNGNEDRTALSVIVKVNKTDSLRFVCTHLDAFDANIRLAQMSELCDRYKDSSIATIVAGDFNETPDDSAGTIARFKTVFTQACTKSGATFPASKPKSKIDYIGYYPNSKFNAVKCENINTLALSDHRAVVVKLKLK